MHYPRRDRPYIINTDASTVALGILLCQEDDRSSTELKLLAIVWALDKFRQCILGAKLLVRFDHQALSFLKSCRLLNSRLTRWILLIQDYDLQMAYIPGSENKLADILSRLPGHEKRREKIEINKISLTCKLREKIIATFRDIRNIQSKDKNLARHLKREDEKGCIVRDGVLTVLDYKTRWNSTYDMLKVTLDMKEAVKITCTS